MPPRSLFANRPDWAAPAAVSAPATEKEEKKTATTGSGDQDLDVSDIFTRKTSALGDIMREREEERRRRRRRKRVERAAAQSARREGSGKGEGEGHGEGQGRKRDAAAVKDGSAKRRRISEEDYVRYGLVSPQKQAAEKEEEEGEEVEEEDFVDKAVRRKSEHLRRYASGLAESEDAQETKESRAAAVDKSPGHHPPEPPTKVISLSSSDNDDHDHDDHGDRGEAFKPVGRKASTPPSVLSDEEFPELARKARERRRARDLAGGVWDRSAATSSPYGLLPDRPSEPERPDPVVKLFITSPLPGTKPLLVHRLLSQRLMEVRQVWCERQGLDAGVAAGVFLVHKMRRLYDVTTCRSLGLKTDANGELINQDGTYRGTGKDAEKVHLLAVTEAHFREMKTERDRKRLDKLNGGEMAGAAAAAADDEVVEEVAKEEKIKLILKCKGYKDFRLIVHGYTTFRDIVKTFRKSNGLPSHANVSIVQDGEPFNEDEKVEDTEVESMDCLDVHIKES